METTDKINIRVITNTKNRLNIFKDLLDFLCDNQVCGMLNNMYILPVNVTLTNNNPVELLFNALQLNSAQSNFMYNCFNLNLDD